MNQFDKERPSIPFISFPFLFPCLCNLLVKFAQSQVPPSVPGMSLDYALVQLAV